MDDTAKYLIHADFTASGVVERSDVVGAVFGQTEGLLGTELDLRDLQQSSKVGRIDVEVQSEEGHSYGHITIASNLDRVETAILAASLETIDRVGPCRSTVTVERIEDVREAKRREVVARAKELLATAFDESVMSSMEVLEEVRESVRVEDITRFEGLPAGPRVANSDAVIIVEGRSDVLTLLSYGIKNAIAVEGTDVPDAVSDLTETRTATAFLDGDRGGDLILRELGQVADVDYVARAPAGKSVEDLNRREVTEALRSKVAFDDARPVGRRTADGTGPEDAAEEPGDELGEPGDEPDQVRATAAADAGSVAESTDGGDPTRAGRPSGDAALAVEQRSRPAARPAAAESAAVEESGDAAESVGAGESAVAEAVEAETGSEGESSEAGTGSEAEADATDTPVPTLADHVEAVADSGTVRLLDGEWACIAETDADEAFEAVESAAEVPAAVVLDGTVTQRLLDVAAQRGVRRVVGTDLGEFTKQPAAVRVHTVAELLGDE